MKKYILWKNDGMLAAGTTLRVAEQPENFNMALHVGGDKENILKNRNKFCEDFNISLNQCVFAQQTHSDHLIKVTNADSGRGSDDAANAIPDCDALYTKEKGIMLGVFHADCVPVLIYDPIQELICAIHAGWQGTVKEITGKAINYLKENEGVDPSQLLVYIGPAICQDNFEVGEEVVELINNMSFDTSAFVYQNTETKKAYVDNKGLNREQCILAGVPYTNISVDKNCTYSNQENFFSYRRDKNCGRHMSFIMMKEGK
ncbi:peptidoglycan editing factor PgeF [Dielma fastidiosa]|uniref:peptidoglycan editing factor PgeF n=1 Tax=Dielma fastidiosa TaxID=1034346 RepID=UPI00356978C6